MDGPLDFGIPPAGHRLPAPTRVGGIRLQVSDLARSIDYYRRVIGLTTVDVADDTALLAPAGGGRPLVRLQSRAGLMPAPRRGAFGLYHFAILLPDRAALGRFVTHLANIGEHPGAADHLVSEALYLHDPDGLGIEVYSDRPRDTWRHDRRELAMASEPLDFASVAAAGRGEPWTGAPAGTTIGHLHLHVGNLEAAKDFYHRALGFDITAWSYPGALFFSAGGYHHHLGVNTWSPGPAASSLQARLLDWELIVPRAADAAAAAHRVATAGYHSTEDVDGWTLTDPWGTQLVVRAA